MSNTQAITVLTSSTIITIETGFDVYAINASSNITITLPDIAIFDGIPMRLMRVDNTNNIVIVIGVNGQLINGSSSFILSGLSFLLLLSYQGAWYGSTLKKQTIPYSSGFTMRLTTDGSGNPSNAGVLAFGSNIVHANLVNPTSSIDANSFAYVAPYPGTAISLYGTIVSTSSLTFATNPVVVFEIYVATDPNSLSFASTGFTLSLTFPTTISSGTIVSGSSAGSLVINMGTRVLLRVILASNPSLPNLSLPFVVQGGILLV